MASAVIWYSLLCKRRDPGFLWFSRRIALNIAADRYHTETAIDSVRIGQPAVRCSTLFRRLKGSGNRSAKFARLWSNPSGRRMPSQRGQSDETPTGPFQLREILSTSTATATWTSAIRRDGLHYFRRK
jgi:hypothetical protein